MIVLGAGASHGSLDARPATPPLGYQLFFDMRCSNPEGIANSIDGKFAESFSRSFEDGMEIMYQWQEFKDIAKFQREIGICLLRFSPKKKNLYSQLIQSIKDKINRVCFVSLNYDLLLEDCALLNGLGVMYWGDAKPKDMELLKIHGSANFLPYYGNSSISGFRFVAPKGVGHVNCDIRPASRAEAIEFCEASDSAPILAQYMRGKYFLHGMRGIERIVRQFHFRLAEAKKVLIIGVAVVEEDEHIWGKFENLEAEILYVGREGDCEKFKSWSKKHSRNSDTVLAYSFQDAIGLVPTVFK
ncbi:hypothetical protein [Idiomarina abyssalis]|uniref:hypothetical protein n=1 Tax=Idiomarina abyssalis TaxID=86102 RepID=UPI003A9570BA